jgi:hypothetical protein
MLMLLLLCFFVVPPVDDVVVVVFIVVAVDVVFVATASVFGVVVAVAVLRHPRDVSSLIELLNS